MMSHEQNLRVALFYFTFSVVGCSSELPVVGDASGNTLQRGDEILQLENTNSGNPQSSIPITSTFQRNLPVFNSEYQASRINLVSYSQTSNGNAKRTSFNSTAPTRPMDVMHYLASQPKVNSVNNPELTGDSSQSKNRYAFQRLQLNPNALNFTRSLKSTVETNLASGVIKKEGLVNEKYAPNLYSSGLLKSKSEMYSDSPQPFEVNEANLRRNISIQSVIRSEFAKRISADSMYRNLNGNHDMRQKNNGSILYDHKNILPIAGQNEKTSSKVIQLGKSLAIVRANRNVDTSSTVISQISNDIIKPAGISKVFAPQTPAATAAMPKPQAITKSQSDGIKSILPLRKAKLFSYQHDQVGQYQKKNVSPKARGSFKGFQHDSLRASQDAYQNSGCSWDPIVQDFYSQRKYEGTSAIRPPAANIARSYRGFLSAETNGIQTQRSVASIRPKKSSDTDGKAINSSPRIQMEETPLVIPEPETTEVKSKIKLSAILTSSLWTLSQHRTERGNHLISSGRSTAHSLFINIPMPHNTMEIYQSVSQSVSGTQDIYTNSGTSTSQSQPHYLTSRKPYALKGFKFFPTEQAPAQHRAQNNPRGGDNATKESQSDKHPLETSRGTSGRHIPSQNTQAFDRRQTDSILQKSSVFNTTSERSTNGRFARPNIYRNLFMKSRNVSSVSTKANNVLDMHDSVVTTGTTNANTLSEFPSLYHKTGLSQGTSQGSGNIQLPTRQRNDETVSLRPDKLKSGKNYPLSHFLPSIFKSNKVTGYPLTLNAAVQRHSSDVQKNIKTRDGLFIPTKEIKDRNAGELIQVNTNEMRRPTSSVLIGRRVKASKEGKKSEKNSVYTVPTSQSPIYRSSSIHKGNSSAKPAHLPTIHKSVIKPYGKAKIFYAHVAPDLPKNETRMSVNRSASEMDIDLSAVGVSQTLRPTSSFVVGKYLSVLETNLTKLNLSASQANGLHNFKPVRFADIAGSASFTGIRPRTSAVESKATFRSILNISTSTPGTAESFTELPFAMTTDNFSMITDLKENIEIDLQSTVTTSIPRLMPTAVTTEPQPSFTEVSAAPQTTAYSFELEPDPGNQSTPTAQSIIPEVLIPNTTMLVTMTSD